MKKRKKYNSSTGGYKIDVLINGNYYCSTAWYKTCKAAKESVIKTKPGIDPKTVTAYFDYQ